MDIMTIISNAAGELIAPTTAAYVLAAIGLNIHFGMTGLMNMGQAGFMLLGAYGFAITQSMGCNLFASVCAALALAVIYALLLGIPTLKLGPDYLAMVTLAAAEIIRIIGRSTAMTNFTGGPAGISPQDFTEKFESLSPLPDGSTTFLLWTYSNNIANSWWLRIVAWVLVVIAALLCWRWFHSPWGRMLKGIREDENAIRSLGKPVTRYKMESLILGGLFGAIAGSFVVDEGTIRLDGQNITSLPDYKRSKFIGRLFQDPLKGTAPSMTIEENLALAFLRASGHTSAFSRINKKDRELFAEKLSALGLGLEDRMKQPVGLLSGGQRQALTLLMATMNKPKLLLLDEHTAALDPKTALKVLTLSAKIVEENHLTTMMITHNMKDAIKYGNRLIMMYEGHVIYDVRGEEKKNLQVSDLLQRFEQVSDGEFANDRMLLS